MTHFTALAGGKEDKEEHWTETMLRDHYRTGLGFEPSPTADSLIGSVIKLDVRWHDLVPKYRREFCFKLAAKWVVYVEIEDLLVPRHYMEATTGDVIDISDVVNLEQLGLRVEDDSPAVESAGERATG